MLWVREGRRGERAEEIVRLATERGIPHFLKKAEEFESVASGINHQGILAFCEAFSYSNLGVIIENAQRAPHSGLVVAADHITDEGNLGALIRTCAFFGIHGLILPRDRSASVTSSVIKRCAGTHLHLPIAQVVNLGRALDDLSEKGFWIIGAAGESAGSIYQFDWIRDAVLVFGSEEKGLGRSIRLKCHELLSIPGAGTVDSLNVSVAAGIVLSEIWRQRKRGAPSAPGTRGSS